MGKREPLTYEQAWNYALRLLNQRHYSEARLHEKLRQRGAEGSDITKIIDRLRELKLLDDKRYAEMVLRHELVFRHTSRRRAALKLRQKGVEGDIINQTLSVSEEGASDSELERAKYHARRYLPKLRQNTLFEQKQKLTAYLYRKGFDTSTIQRLIGELEEI